MVNRCASGCLCIIFEYYDGYSAQSVGGNVVKQLQQTADAFNPWVSVECFNSILQPKQISSSLSV